MSLKEFLKDRMLCFKCVRCNRFKFFSKGFMVTSVDLEVCYCKRCIK